MGMSRKIGVHRRGVSLRSPVFGGFGGAAQELPGHAGVSLQRPPTPRVPSALPTFATGPNRSGTMLKWALFFLIISIIAGLFGFTGISAATAGVAKILFVIFIVIFVIFLILALMAGKAIL
jgi:uncharacterized membrane protein YtjA (UPF0391 family)